MSRSESKRGRVCWEGGVQDKSIPNAKQQKRQRQRQKRRNAAEDRRQTLLGTFICRRRRFTNYLSAAIKRNMCPTHTHTHTLAHWHTRTRWLTKWPTGRINSCVFWPHIEEHISFVFLSHSTLSFDCISFYLIS